jgi:hypothetical protein
MRAMGFLDRAKRWLGVGAEGDDEEAASAPAPAEERASPNGPAARAAAAEARRPARGGRERPSLKDIEPPPQIGVDDALAAREAGDPAEARRILREIDRGKGLRTVLRAAAALEAGDEAEVRSLLSAVAREEPPYWLPLQVAAALGDPDAAAPYLGRAEREGAPAWLLAWSRALSRDEATRREGLVDLLFADPALARTVAARDLDVAGAVSDGDGAKRYASFAHGRDSIRRFGAATVARVLDRAGIGA